MRNARNLLHRHTHPTTLCWLHTVRATVRCLSECYATDLWMKKAMWASKMAQTKPDPNNSLPASSEMAFHEVHDYLLLFSS